MDWTLIVSGVTLALLLATLAIVWRKYKALKPRFEAVDRLLGSNPEETMQKFLATFAQRAKAWMFIDSGQVIDGKKVFNVNPEFKEIVSLAIPEIIGQGMLWAKQNIKLKDVMESAPGGAGLANPAMIQGAMKQFGVPKDWQGPLSFLLTYGKDIMNFFKGRVGGGGSSSAPGASSGNPFGPP